MVIDVHKFEILLSEISTQGLNIEDTKGRTLLHALCLHGM